MKKKSRNNKKWLSLLVLIALTILIVPNNVFASPEPNGLNTNGSSAAKEACQKALFGSKDTKNIISINDDTREVVVNAKTGTWTIRIWYGAYGPDNGIYYTADSSYLQYKDKSSSEGGPKIKQDYQITATSGPYKTILPNLEYSTDDGETIIVTAELKDNVTTTYTTGSGNNKQTHTATCKKGSVTYDPGDTNKPDDVVFTHTAAYAWLNVGDDDSSDEYNVAEDDEEDEDETESNSQGLKSTPKNECQAMKDAKKGLNDTKPYLDASLIEGYNKKMASVFPYCYGKYKSSFKISAKTIKTVREKSLEAYKLDMEFKKNLEESKNGNVEYKKALDEINDKTLNYTLLLDYTEKDGMKKQTLQCDKEQLEERTARYYTKRTEVNGGANSKNACNVECLEQIQVTYDPPVATKAGLCFQYKVTVKSKTTCKVEQTKDIEWPNPPSSCGFTPLCSGGTSQAGPNEEFDSCINSCDGGKYSQKCINSCYKEVYESNNKNTSTRKTSTESIENIFPTMTKLASKKDPYKTNKNCNSNDKILSNIDECSNFFYKTKQSYPNGKYVEKSFTGYLKNMNVNYDWVPKNKTWDNNRTDKGLHTPQQSVIDMIKRSSPYYFRNKNVAKKTIYSFYAYGNGYNGYGTARKYIIDNHGIKRQWTSNYHCNETCGYKKDKNTKNKECINNDDKVREYYTKALDTIIGQLDKCTVVAKCKESKEDENTFTIEADNSAMKDSVRKESQFEAQNYTSQNKKCKDPSGNIQMFIPLNSSNTKETQGLAGHSPYDLEQDNQYYEECSLNSNNGINGKCYGKDNLNYWQHYKTTITYPGTWINLKTAERRYVNDNLDENAVREKKNYYCTGYDFEPVNQQWWNWKINPADCEGNSGIPEDMSTINTLTDKIDYNIKASIIKFGKYNWNLDVNCFYGLSNTLCIPPKGTKPSCEDENSTELCNATFRPVTASNLFPSSDGNGTREAGFNWTNEATDETIAASVNQVTGYGIKPGDYAKELQEKAKSNDEVSFSGTADYYIHLTKDNIKALRKYAKDNGYTSFGLTKDLSKTPAGTYTPVDGVEGLYYYKSNLLKDNKYVEQKSFEKNVELGVNNN